MYSEKGKQLRVVNNFKFRFHKLLANEVQRWSCVEKKCKAFLKVSSDGVIVQEPQTHNHLAENDRSLAVQRINNDLKRKATEDLCERPSKLICRSLQPSHLSVVTCTDITKFRKNLHRARSKLLPPLPKTLDELHGALQKMDLATKNNEPFLLVNDSDHNIVIFSAPKNLKFLVKCDALLMDGTFYSCPKLFYQLFTIHGIKNGVYVPLIFCLLPNKMEATYERTLRYVQRHLPVEYCPPTALIDFEEAIHAAFKQVWPNSAVRGCRFHLGQAWHRKIQALGLAKLYREKSDEGSYLRTFFGLPFLPPTHVEPFFVENLMSITPTLESIEKFNDYILENYIAPNSRYPPEVWAAYSSSNLRTTNACEAFHSKIKESFYHAHPNIYKLIDTLQELQNMTYVKITTAHAEKNRRHESEKEKFINEMMMKLQQADITVYEYVRGVSRKFLPPKI